MISQVGISLGVQVGGEDADRATDRIVTEFRRLLEKYCSKQYSPDAEEIALVLRIDGDVSAFELEGSERLRRSVKRNYITIDVGVPIWRWKGKSEWDIRHYLLDSVKVALKKCVQRLKKDKAGIDESQLCLDFALVEAEFLKSGPIQ